MSAVINISVLRVNLSMYVSVLRVYLIYVSVSVSVLRVNLSIYVSVLRLS